MDIEHLVSDEVAAKLIMAMDRLYCSFVQQGDLVFDMGAHVGDRTSSFRRLGAQVVAVEPQLALSRTLRVIHVRDDMVAIDRVAGSHEAGRARMMVNTDNPTVSTLSDAFVAAANSNAARTGQKGDEFTEVEVLTLDHLTDKYGNPTFIKLDAKKFYSGGLSRSFKTRPLSVV